MVVYISEELLHIKEGLEKRGYEVVSTMNNTACDAIICNLKNGGLSKLGNENNIKTTGTLIIDAGSKSIDELEYILNNRVYSSLF